jgi:hypothetical protein
MMEEDFYATIKLKTGEEIFCMTSVSEEENKTLLIISNPITIQEVKSSRSGISAYKVEPWLKSTSEDMFIINFEDVLTITENNDLEMIMMHNNFLRSNKSKKYKNTFSNQETITKEMGYIANIKKAKEDLENIYKNS